MDQEAAAVAGLLEMAQEALAPAAELLKAGCEAPATVVRAGRPDRHPPAVAHR